MSQYVRCVKNDTYFQEDLADTFVELQIGRVYKRLPLYPEEQDSGMVRIVDDSGEAYLFPEDYFESYTPNGKNHATETITTHVPEWMKNILYAEALAANKSVSALLREWIDERLDLPARVTS